MWQSLWRLVSIHLSHKFEHDKLFFQRPRKRRRRRKRRRKTSYRLTWRGKITLMSQERLGLQKKCQARRGRTFPHKLTWKMASRTIRKRLWPLNSPWGQNLHLCQSLWWSVSIWKPQNELRIVFQRRSWCHWQCSLPSSSTSVLPLVFISSSCIWYLIEVQLCTFIRNKTFLNHSITALDETWLMWPWRVKMQTQNMGLKVRSALFPNQICCWCFVQITKIKFGQDFGVDFFQLKKVGEITSYLFFWNRYIYGPRYK